MRLHASLWLGSVLVAVLLACGSDDDESRSTPGAIGKLAIGEAND